MHDSSAIGIQREKMGAIRTATDSDDVCEAFDLWGRYLVS
jgi:hypothetical protein